jgi:hypothetical protein
MRHDSTRLTGQLPLVQFGSAVCFRSITQQKGFSLPVEKQDND